MSSEPHEVDAGEPTPALSSRSFEEATRRLRVLFLARYYYWWGAPRAGMLHLAMSPLGLRDRGHDVRFVCERRLGQRLDDDGIDVRWFAPPLRLDPTTLYSDPKLDRLRIVRSALVRASHLQFLAGLWREALDACRDWRPDIVYCQAEQPAPVAAAIARRFGVPLVVHAYGGGGVSAAQARSKTWRAARYLDTVYAYRAGAAALLVVDDGTGGDELARTLGAPPGIIHHWSIPVASPSPPATPTHRARLGIPSDAPVAISAARMVPLKRMDLCLDAYATALERNPAAHGVLVGDGPDLAAIRERASRLRGEVARRIHFPGYLQREELSQLLQESNVFLTMQEVSVSGTNLRDAMMHGLCVVAVQRDQDRALAGLISDRENGRLVPEREISSTGEVVAELLADPDTARRLGTSASATAETAFETWQKRLDTEERLLLSISRAGERP